MRRASGCAMTSTSVIGKHVFDLKQFFVRCYLPNHELRTKNGFCSVEGEQNERHQIPESMRNHDRYETSLPQIKKPPEKAADGCSHEKHKVESKHMDECIDG